MVSFTLMLGPRVRHQFGRGMDPIVVQPGHIFVKDFAQPATAWWETSSRSLNLHIPRLTVETAAGNKVEHLHGTVLSEAGLSSMLEAQLLNSQTSPHVSQTGCGPRRWTRQLSWR